MSTTERESILAIGLFAALADGDRSNVERDRLKASLAKLNPADDLDVGRVYERVLLKHSTPAWEAGLITTPENRRLAYESAVAICDADDVTSPAEQAFLTELATSLGIPQAEAQAVIRQAEAMTLSDLLTPPVAVGITAAPAATSEAKPSADGTRDREIDESIRKYAMLCAAVELLPQSVASMAIIPLQMKMVYGIGQRYGFSLDRGHIKDLLATLGVGATSQVVEGYARKLLGGLIGKAGRTILGSTVGGMAGGLGTVAVGAGITFATTHALGRVARQYYAGGRKFSAVDLQSLFQSELASARTTYESVAPQIQSQASRLNPMELMRMLGRG